MMRAMRSFSLPTALSLTHRLMLGALPMLLLACGGAPKAPPGDAGGPVVLLISMDGFRHDYPDRVPTPHFDAIKVEGAAADRLIPPYPSQTFASHASMATGVVTERHGIMNNRFRDRNRGLFSYADQATWYDRAPLWIHATRQGVRSHVFHWIGSRGPYEGVEPAEARNYDNTTTDDEKVDTILGWLQGPTPPRLIMSYFRGCDHAGHEHGPDSAEVTDCIVETDARLGRLRARLATLPHAITTIIVSDHGMTNTVGEINVYDAFFESKHAIDIIPSGPVAHLFMSIGATPCRRGWATATRIAPAIWCWSPTMAGTSTRAPRRRACCPVTMATIRRCPRWARSFGPGATASSPAPWPACPRPSIWCPPSASCSRSTRLRASTVW